MTRTKPYHIVGALLLLFSGSVVLIQCDTASAQEPPTEVPFGGPPYDPNAITINGWILYPSLDFFTANSDNYFLSPASKISGWSIGVSPSVTAEWSNGIHSTVLYANYQNVEYPTNSAVTTNDGEATFTQRYAPLRDLTFSILGDYTHKTLAGMTSAISGPITLTGTQVLSDGNIERNGNIYSPTGQLIGHVAPSLNASPLLQVNPNDQYTTTAGVQKLFNDGILNLTASLQRTDYEKQASESLDTTARTFTEDAAFWLGPLFYFYTDGAFTSRINTNPNPDTTAYQVIGGIGTRQFGLFRASAYFGHQGSRISGQGSAGGDTYGGVLTYYPTEDLTVTANLGKIINIAPTQGIASTEALSLPGTTPLQISISSSTDITAASLRTDYQISPQWMLSGIVGHTRIEYLGSTSLTTTWLVDATLKYQIWRNMTLSWEYQYSSIASNIPLTSAVRNLLTMGTSYKF